MLALSTNSVHRVVADATHASLTEDPREAGIAAQAVIDVVSAVRTGAAGTTAGLARPGFTRLPAQPPRASIWSTGAKSSVSALASPTKSRTWSMSETGGDLQHQHRTGCDEDEGARGPRAEAQGLAVHGSDGLGSVWKSCRTRVLPFGKGYSQRPKATKPASDIAEASISGSISDDTVARASNDDA
jgi:hypothetical protein